MPSALFPKLLDKERPTAAITALPERVEMLATRIALGD